jgi:hypothetical protein
MYNHLPISSIPHPHHARKHLRLSQDPQLPIARRIARHEQSALRIPRQTRRPEASRTEARSITLTLLNVRIVEDVFGRSRACQRLNGRVLSVLTELEAHSDELETRDRGAVPRAVVRDVHGAGVGIELAVNGRRVREECKLRSGSLLLAGIVVEGAVRGLHEEVADIEFLVGEVRGLPHAEAGWVAVPVVVWLGDVAHVVDLLSWVVLVDVLGLAIDSALEIVATVLYTPEPIMRSEI